MSLFVMKAEKNQRWADAQSFVGWDDGDCPAALLREFRIAGERLSFFEVDSKDDPNWERLVAAFAANRDQSPASMAFRVVPREEMERFINDIGGMELIPEKGELKDETINNAHWNLVGLTGRGMLRLARLLKNDSREFKKKKVQDCLIRSLDNAHLLVRDLPDNLLLFVKRYDSLTWQRRSP